MTADPIALPVGRGRPSRLHLDGLRAANEHLRAEVRSLRLERREDVETITPYLRRLELVAYECGPAAMSAVHAIEARLERMARRDQRRPESAT